MPYPCSHFYFDINFGDRLYSKEKRPDIKVKVTTWIGHKVSIIRPGRSRLLEFEKKIVLVV